VRREPCQLGRGTVEHERQGFGISFALEAAEGAVDAAHRRSLSGEPVPVPPKQNAERTSLPPLAVLGRPT